MSKNNEGRPVCECHHHFYDHSSVTGNCELCTCDAYTGPQPLEGKCDICKQVGWHDYVMHAYFPPDLERYPSMSQPPTEHQHTGQELCGVCHPDLVPTTDAQLLTQREIAENASTINRPAIGQTKHQRVTTVECDCSIGKDHKAKIILGLSLLPSSPQKSLAGMTSKPGATPNPESWQNVPSTELIERILALPKKVIEPYSYLAVDDIMALLAEIVE